VRERIEPLGGRLSTEALAGGGFRLTVDVPLQQ
jgi:signal transduction histidine kinase